MCSVSAASTNLYSRIGTLAAAGPEESPTVEGQKKLCDTICGAIDENLDSVDGAKDFLTDLLSDPQSGFSPEDKEAIIELAKSDPEFRNGIRKELKIEVRNELGITFRGKFIEPFTETVRLGMDDDEFTVLESGPGDSPESTTSATTESTEKSAKNAANRDSLKSKAVDWLKGKGEIFYKKLCSCIKFFAVMWGLSQDKTTSNGLNAGTFFLAKDPFLLHRTRTAEYAKNPDKGNPSPGLEGKSDGVVTAEGAQTGAEKAAQDGEIGQREGEEGGSESSEIPVERSSGKEENSLQEPGEKEEDAKKPSGKICAADKNKVVKIARNKLGEILSPKKGMALQLMKSGQSELDDSMEFHRFMDGTFTAVKTPGLGNCMLCSMFILGTMKAGKIGSRPVQSARDIGLSGYASFEKTDLPFMRSMIVGYELIKKLNSMRSEGSGDMGKIEASVLILEKAIEDAKENQQEMALNSDEKSQIEELIGENDYANIMEYGKYGTCLDQQQLRHVAKAYNMDIPFINNDGSHAYFLLRSDGTMHSSESVAGTVEFDHFMKDFKQAVVENKGMIIGNNAHAQYVGYTPNTVPSGTTVVSPKENSEATNRILEGVGQLLSVDISPALETSVTTASQASETEKDEDGYEPAGSNEPEDTDYDYVNYSVNEE
jgi:hypothetical protein